MITFDEFIKDKDLIQGIIITIGNTDYNALFSNARIDKKSVPTNYRCYELRENDNGDIGELAPEIIVNHFGSIITNEKIDFGSETSIIFDENTNDYSFDDSAILDFSALLPNLCDELR